MRPRESWWRATLGIALGVVLCIAPVASGDGPAPAAPASRPAAAQETAPPDVDALIRQLGHRDWRAREQAQSKLAELGPAVESRLQELVKAGGGDEQTCLGAQLVLAQIEITRRLGPTRVSVHADGVPPRQVFADLSRQGGIGIVPVHGERTWEQKEWPPITLNFSDRPFWEVVRQACARSGLRPLFAGGDEEPGRIVLTPDLNHEMDRPVAFSGSIMVVATSAVKRMRLSAGILPIRGNEVELQFTFFADPKWRILEPPLAVTVDSVTDASGAAISRPDPMRMQTFRAGSPIWLMRTMMTKVPSDVKKFSSVRGSFTITLLEQSPPIEFTEILTARNVVRKEGRQAVYLQEVSRQANNYRVQLTVNRNGLSDQPWRQAREAEGIQMRDERGRALTRRSFEAVDHGNQVVYDLTFTSSDAEDGPGAPARLVCVLPLEPRDANISFELKDIDLE